MIYLFLVKLPENFTAMEPFNCEFSLVPLLVMFEILVLALSPYFYIKILITLSHVKKANSF